MRIAIASGKGGTGKTTVATSLAAALVASGRSVTYVDCDVEEPNGHIFLRPEIEQTEAATVRRPVVDLRTCTYCGACTRACRSSAIVALPGVLLTFPKLCSGCGGCALACPFDAIREEPRRVGDVEQGWAPLPGLGAARLRFVHGRLDVGEAKSPPLIQAVLRAAVGNEVVIIDAPPGTSCPVVAAVHDADVVLLVAEPTPFGLNDLELAADLLAELRIPCAVVVNRAGLGGDSELSTVCRDRGLPILAWLPDDRTVAQGYCNGRLALHVRPELQQTLTALAAAAERLALAGGAAGAAPRSPHRGSSTSAARALLGSPGPVAQTPVEALDALGERGRGRPLPRELVVISGKGGTGKTSIVGAFAALAGDAVLADCDVDAADLHLLLSPQPEATWPFAGGSMAEIDAAACTGCGICAQLCRFDALQGGPGPVPDRYVVDPLACEGCGVCVEHCPEHAVRLQPALNGRWSVASTALGLPLLHARLGAAEDNSGKLVALLRQQARALARLQGRSLLLVDGPPGIGCPVISSGHQRERRAGRHRAQPLRSARSAAGGRAVRVPPSASRRVHQQSRPGPRAR